MKKILPFLLIGGVALYLYGKQYAAKLSFWVSRIDFNLSQSLNSGFTSFYFDVYLSASNPNPTPLTVKSFTVDFYLKGVKVGNVSRFTGFSLEPKKTVSEKVLLQVPVQSVPFALANLFDALKTGGELTLDAKAKVNTALLGELNFSNSMPVLV